AVFLESAGHTQDLPRLLAEAHRVLTPGGALYIKDVFCREAALQPAEQHELGQFDEVYRYNTLRISAVLAEAERAGFVSPRARDLTGLIGTRAFDDAMLTPPEGQGPSMLNE